MGTQLDLFPTIVDVHHIAEKCDRKTGQPYEFTHSMDESQALEHVRKVNAGKMRDPFGNLWGKVTARIVR